MRVAPFGFALLALVLAVTGCGNRSAGPAAPGGGDPGLRGHTFLSTSVTEDGKQRQLAEQTRVRLQFTDDGRLLADGGCNLMQGPVTLTGGRVEVADLSMTGMGCDPPRHKQDDWLAGFLNGKPAWRMDGANLVISAGSTEMVLVDRSIAEPDLALEGTKWMLETIIDGQTASSTPAGSSASLLLEQGTAQVQSGCNSGSATYQVDGDKIRFDGPAMTRKGCPPDLATLEESVVAVVSGEVTFEIDADRLTLTHPSGKALEFRGERD